MAIRVVVVDDSVFIRQALTRLLEDVPSIEVVGTASSGEELLKSWSSWSPDVVTLDLMMPGLSGLDTLRRIMDEHPVPVVILSTQSQQGAPRTIDALLIGAVDFIDKTAYSLVDFKALRVVLEQKILAAAATRAKGSSRTPGAPENSLSEAQETPLATQKGDHRLVVLGASTGGPQAIEQVLRDLGKGLRTPLLIVQHMPSGFTSAFAARLDRNLPLPVREAQDGELLETGSVYLAPAGEELSVSLSGEKLIARLGGCSGNKPHCPSVDALFYSAARVLGPKVVAVLLTGMGRDGAQGLAELHQLGAHTICQDEGSCVIFGMPRVAIELGAANEVLGIDRIGARLRDLLG